MEEIPARGIGDGEIEPGIQEIHSQSPETPSEIEPSLQDSDFTTSDSDSDDDDSSDDEPDQEYDLATTILNEIKDETYICLICTCEVGPGGKFWSCGDCYRVYHMSCIESWSKKGSSTDVEGNWKCPACNSKHRKQKFQHKCWCKKTLHPPNNPLNPGSCGQSCGVPLNGCIHKCPLPCHPGPHAECNALGPIMKCRCGNHDNQWPCVMTPYLDGWQCEDICEELLPCEIHRCGKTCHDGLCGKCERFIESKCYCGNTTDNIKCHSKQPRKSFGKTKDDNWIGNFQCSVSSEITYDCGNHSELKSCQSVKRKAAHCPLSPDIIKNCPCGQTLIEDLNEGTNRSSCTDPIPTCEKICGKTLACGHKCKWVCHQGECSPCYENIKSDCQCGFNTFISPCKFLMEFSKPTCSRKCTSLLSCRRHRCNKICCQDEKEAMNRERLRKKGIRHNTISTNNRGNRDNEAFNIEASHICLQICNKKLTCGNPDHLCQQTCHTGPCPPCLESSNDDLICHCGQTVVMAPVRCGTQLPQCYSQCMRELPCGHQQMPHNCHPDDVPCSRCTKTVEKWCNCGKNKLKAMCYQTEVFCAERCGKILPCKHHCISNCHSGECICRSICGKKKKYCSHVDRSPCHFPSRCNDTGICNQMVKLTCKCGRLKKDIPCGANSSKTSCEGTTLECDVSCIVQERQEQLEAAFGVSKLSVEPRIKVEDLPYTPGTLKTYKLQTRWCSNIEDTIKRFMKSTENSYHFKPMRKEQRLFIHEISDAYKLFSESQDPDPRRSVFIMKRDDSITSPLSLEKSLEIYENHLKETAKTSKSVTPEVSEQEQFDHNAIIIQDCIPGVTRPELEETVIPIMKESPLVKNPRFYWVEADNYLILPEAHMKVTRTVETELKLLVPTLKAMLSTKFLANTVKLAKVDSHFNIVAMEE
ncbi:hypothetical protein BN7_1040 [Wickerhamomyces ciferrii]|uniref:FKBP12-associated protein 1 n=1 Tax=Wickerhamomyces ciferrii (strain ATCC 14091 / BCRC 22168 / CBS 111 / JCM 3599 / NBRC 0793 / NRRL Y-1031 F-60-10) TaxID=1206466 RepID=K0KJ42_WICCF|nr:uncharacterized protein BN7_1040 [Wickerhamomyces ciferrii]CCH41499.1 hypothetical protein BN7_1040 [Wickerhamomyces ciferrii]